MSYLTSGQHGNATIGEGDWHCKHTKMLGARQTDVEHALGLCVGACFPRLEQSFTPVFRSAIGWNHDAHCTVLTAFRLVNLGTCKAKNDRHLKMVRPLRILIRNVPQRGSPHELVTH